MCAMSTDGQLKLSELRTLVVIDEKVCLKWEDIGMAVGLADDDDGEYLDTLPGKYPDDEKCFLAVLKKWLRASKEKDPSVKPATWRSLLNAMKDLGFRDRVMEIEKHFGMLICLRCNKRLVR